MVDLEWVDVDKVGGKHQWGDVSRLVIGRERDREIADVNGKKHTVIEKVTKIERLENGSHLVYTSSTLPELEGE